MPFLPPLSPAFCSLFQSTSRLLSPCSSFNLFFLLARSPYFLARTSHPDLLSGPLFPFVDLNTPTFLRLSTHVERWVIREPSSQA